MTLYPKSFGIDCLFFPSKNLGVAVGALASFGINTPGTVGYPNIIMTIDQGTTWMAVTGTTAVASVAGLNAVASTSAPYPVRSSATHPSTTLSPSVLSLPDSLSAKCSVI